MRGRYWPEMSQLPFRTYRASVSQAVFLREVMRDIPDCTVAGSYPAALFMHHAADVGGFRPNDLDVRQP